MDELKVIPYSVLHGMFALDAHGNLYKWRNADKYRKIKAHWMKRKLASNGKSAASRLYITVNGFTLHQSLGQAMLNTFGVARPTEDHVSYHKDNDASNNHIDNIAWGIMGIDFNIPGVLPCLKK